MNFYKILTTMSVLCLIAGIALGQQTNLKGNVRGLGDAELTIRYSVGDENKTSKVVVTADKFSWIASMPNPQKITIMFPKRPVRIFVESGNIEITGSLDSLNKLKVTGSKTQLESEAFAKSTESLSAQLSMLYKEIGKGSDEEQVKLEQKIADLQKKLQEKTIQYIEMNPESAFCLNLVTEESRMGKYQDVKNMFSKLGNIARESPEAKQIAKRLIVLKRSEIGEKIQNFTQNDIEGKPINFESFRGKYVLIDFWASWCRPCRAENPNLLNSYNNYKDKNFTVIGVSLDDKEANWKKAVKEDGLPWAQLSDLKGAKNEISDYYGIGAIPSNLLIDPKGIIIDKNLRGKKLDRKLKELFN